MKTKSKKQIYFEAIHKSINETKCIQQVENVRQRIEWFKKKYTWEKLHKFLYHYFRLNFWDWRAMFLESCLDQKENELENKTRNDEMYNEALSQ